MSKEIRFDKQFKQPRAILGNGSRWIVSLEKVAASIPVGHSLTCRINT